MKDIFIKDRHLTWDHWYWNDVDYRFGDDWPGRIPA